MVVKAKTEPPAIIDEPGMAERFQHGLKRAFQMPHKSVTPKAKTRPARKGRAHKGKVGS
jgi:hypothetical protein